MKKSIFILLLIGISLSGFSQSHKEVKLIARSLQDSIVLRWAPTDPLTWELGNEYGYQIERYTVLRDGKVLPQAEQIKMNELPVKPEKMENWEVLKEDKYGMIAAQALYGETFEVDGTGSYDFMQVYQKAKENTLRFSLALSAADFSPLVAKFSGLRFVDLAIKKNEKYLYKVYINLPRTESFHIDTGSVFIGSQDYRPLPQPLDVRADFKDRVVDLSWSHERLNNYYIGYWLDRSKDGKNFQQVNSNPIVMTYPEGGKMPELYYRMDSLPVNDQTYYYRVRGISPFGEVGPPSEVISGKGAGLLYNSPHIFHKGSPDNEMVVLEWEYPFADSINVAYYQILRSSRESGSYDTLALNIPASQRKFIDKRPLLTNYYKVSAYNAAGSGVSSLPVLMQLVDSIPPQAPTALVGKVDSTGIVQLEWKASPDTDVIGYRVYRGNSLEEEFSQLTSQPVKQIRYIDTVSVRDLTKKVYYKVMAIDLRQNHSELSEPLALIKPDKIPPVPPVFTSYHSTEEGIVLAWHNSPSSDVSSHLLYRALVGQKSWELIALFPAKEKKENYTDVKTEAGKEYQYTLLAVDESKLESKPATPVKVSRIDRGIRPPIKHVFAEADRQNKTVKLQWEYPFEGVEKYLIYRGKNGEQLSLLASLDGAEKGGYIDNIAAQTAELKYKIVAVYRNGAQGVSEMISIK